MEKFCWQAYCTGSAAALGIMPLLGPSFLPP
jgi:hypothetical protein